MPIVPLKELRKRILQLRSIDHSLDEAGVRKRFLEENAKLTADNKIPFFIRNPESPKPLVGQKLYRTSKHFTGIQEDQVSSYKQPPKLCTKQGRCNLPKYPVFYCSDVLPVCLFEVVQGSLTITNEDLYFSQWEVISDRRWRALAFIFSGLPANNPASSYVNQQRTNVINAFAALLTSSQISDYMDFYHDEFTRAGSHQFSSVVSHQFLYDNDQDDGDLIFYPSVQALKLGNNYAFSERVIDNGEIILRKVYKVHIHELTKTTTSITTWKRELVGVGEVIGSKVQWRAPIQQDIDDLDTHFSS